MKKITRQEAREIALKILADAENERNQSKILTDEQHEILLQHPLYRQIVNRKAD
jgi:hypothetical protein